MLPAEKATELSRQMNKNHRDVFKVHQGFTAAIKKGSAIEDKYQSLIFIACSILSQCDTCISLHVQNAAAQGAPRTRSLMQACWPWSWAAPPR